MSETIVWLEPGFPSLPVLAPCGPSLRSSPGHGAEALTHWLFPAQLAPIAIQVIKTDFIRLTVANSGSPASSLCTSCPNTLAATCDANAKDIAWYGRSTELEDSIMLIRAENSVAGAALTLGACTMW